MKILVIKDQEKLANFLRKGLTESHYTVTLASSCKEASDAISESTFDVIVLDLGLPDGDGLELLKTWRSAGFVEPVIILSARDTVESKILGLNYGADDYLAKPFSIEEFLARVRSLVRRHSTIKSTLLKYSLLEMDLIGHIVKLDGKVIDLTNREYALLEIFLQNQGRILTRTVIAEKVWESHYDVDTNLLDVYMSRLRAKIEIPEKIVFKTIRGVGYQLV